VNWAKLAKNGPLKLFTENGGTLPGSTKAGKFSYAMQLVDITASK